MFFKVLSYWTRISGVVVMVVVGRISRKGESAFLISILDRAKSWVKFGIIIYEKILKISCCSDVWNFFIFAHFSAFGFDYLFIVSWHRNAFPGSRTSSASFWMHCTVRESLETFHGPSKSTQYRKWRDFQVAVVVKDAPANAGDIKRYGFDPWVGKIPWRR